MAETIFPNAEQFDTMNTLLAAIASNTGLEIKLKTFANVQKFNRIGMSQKLFSVGDQLAVVRGDRTLTFDIVDFNKGTPKNTKLTHTVDLLLHDVFTYGTMPFSMPQLMYYTANGLAVGKYKFTIDHGCYGSQTAYDGTYMFTLTKAIPAGGGFRHNNIGDWKATFAKADVIGNYLQTYKPVSNGGAIIETVAVAAYDNSTAINLGTFTASNRSYYTEDDAVNAGGKRNFIERNAYGSNRWRDSVYRLWLNSDAEAVASSDTTTVSKWWTPQTVFDRIPAGAKWAGFLNGLDPDFVSSLGVMKVKTPLHTCDRVGDVTYDITEDKIFLASRQNVYGSVEYSGIDEGGTWEYFKNAVNGDRIKYQDTTARYWWMRTPNNVNCCNARRFTATGSLGNDSASSSHGVVPACCIV